jgi:hypothetical protein
MWSVHILINRRSSTFSRNGKADIVSMDNNCVVSREEAHHLLDTALDAADVPFEENK